MPHAYASPESHATHVSLLPRSGRSVGDDAGAGSALAGGGDAGDDAGGDLEPTTSSCAAPNELAVVDEHPAADVQSKANPVAKTFTRFFIVCQNS